MDLGGFGCFVTPENVHRVTAFATPKGLYQFKVMTFGLVNAGESCVGLMCNSFKRKTSACSLMGFVVYTHTWDEHCMILRDLFDRLHTANHTAKSNKCITRYLA